MIVLHKTLKVNVKGGGAHCALSMLAIFEIKKIPAEKQHFFCNKDVLTQPLFLPFCKSGRGVGFDLPIPFSESHLHVFQI